CARATRLWSRGGVLPAPDRALEVVDGLAQRALQDRESIAEGRKHRLRLLEDRALHDVARPQAAEVRGRVLVLLALEDAGERLEEAADVGRQQLALGPPVEATHGRAGLVQRAVAADADLEARPR